MRSQNNVSVIIPIYNEEKYIYNTLNRIINQTWQGDIEIVIVDGNSSDMTLQIIHKVSTNLPENRKIIVLNNPKRCIPTSLNMACENVSNDIIIRVDGHTFIPLNYIDECMSALTKIKFNGIVGGRCIINQGDDTKIAKGISIAVGNPIGVGNALYRTFKGELEELLDVDTVPFGAFTKELWEKVGGYDEELLYDEDYDFNYRARRLGYRVVMNPKIVLNYFSRKDFKTLWLQYYRYGYWANRFCLKHKIVPSFRRLVPTFFVLALLTLPFISNLLFYLMISMYLVMIFITAFREGVIKRKDFILFVAMIPAFPTLHLSYGFGSILSIIAKLLKF
ncbi:glycosyltransferase family 2 protein [Clostridium sp. SYSU_GA19001]|uniref:glycosyltransferase family 2 protein n=1 Tax=Clostridium caldaquaticum TaxID=2940653 RepID=UPI002077657B|nr:glycosyltransferase family 2 protein [Clostridium caldaquaticum]MCM8711284.1 glycosyltransferase family 2 protein [Clostridium caldaquaticum]